MDEFDERDIWQEKNSSLFFERCIALAFGGVIGGVAIWIIYTIIHWGGK